MWRAAVTRSARGLLPLVVLGVASAAAFGLSSAAATPVPGDGRNTMEVTPADAGVLAMGADFAVSISLVEAELEYMGANFQLEWSDADLDYVSDAPGPLLGLTASLLRSAGAPPGTEQIVAGGVSTTSQITTGKLWEVTLKCMAAGLHSLHLVSTEEDPAFGTATALVAGEPAPMVLQDGQVTCQDGGGPAATATPGVGATPAPTPVGPAATPTPLPPGLEAVPLVAGCNPVASTYPDGTPIQTIADRVGPAGNLVSLWMFVLGTWRAFSPQYPQVSDLTEADLLDVVFACVGGPGDFVRPVV